MVNSRGYEHIAHPGPAETVGPLSNARPDVARTELSQPLEAKLDRILGMLSRHDEGWYKDDTQRVSLAGGLAAGVKVFDAVPWKNDLQARSLIIDNNSAYVLSVSGMPRVIPPYVSGYVLRCSPALHRLDVTISTGQSSNASGGSVIITGTEERLPPTALPLGAEPFLFDGGAGQFIGPTFTQASLGDNVPGMFFSVGVAYLQTGAGVFDAPRTPKVFKPQNAVAVAAETTIWTPAAGKKFRLMGVYLQSSVAGNLLLRDNTAGAIIVVVPSAAAGDASILELGNGILSAAANNVLTCTGPAASTVSGIVFGTEE